MNLRAANREVRVSSVEMGNSALPAPVLSRFPAPIAQGVVPMEPSA